MAKPMDRPLVKLEFLLLPKILRRLYRFKM